MRVREISYSKKIGLPNYSSLGLTVTAEVETNDAFDDAYQHLKNMVDAHLEEVNFSPVQTNGNGHANGNGHGPYGSHQSAPASPPRATSGELATAKQMELVKRLCTEQNRKTPTNQITREEASKLINALFEENKGTSSNRSNGQRNYRSGQRQSSLAHSGNGASHVEKVTEGQRRYLYRLLSNQGYRGDEATNRLLEIFGVESLNQVTKDQASYEIETMVKEVA